MEGNRDFTMGDGRSFRTVPVVIESTTVLVLRQRKEVRKVSKSGCLLTG